MDVILHIGAHRTATTSFQHYMRENAGLLRHLGIGFWGPRRTRDGLLTGVIPLPGCSTAEDQLSRARGRIAINLRKAEAEELRQMVVSDENMIGAPRHNLRSAKLYPAAGYRMARFDTAFAGRITRVVLSIRSQDSYWGSVLSYAVGRGHQLPCPQTLESLARGARGWRDVITDLACALPGAEILVTPHEVFGAMPEQRLAVMTGCSGLPMRHAREQLNRAPGLNALRRIVASGGGDPDLLPGAEGRWRPFGQDQTAQLREAYADDLFWLRAGADGLARLIEETGPQKTEQKPSAAQMTRGRTHGIEKRRLA